MELRGLLRECKRGTKNVKEYTNKKKEYREWIKKKKIEWNERIIEEIERVKSVKNFWRVVNENENRNQIISDKIKKEQWLKFLKEQLKGVDIEEDDGETYTNKTAKDKWEEDVISTEELRNAINKLKKRKAAGRDGIQNEAWIFG